MTRKLCSDKYWSRGNGKRSQSMVGGVGGVKLLISLHHFSVKLTLPRIWSPTEIMFPFFFHINTNPWSLKLKIFHN